MHENGSLPARVKRLLENWGNLAEVKKKRRKNGRKNFSLGRAGMLPGGLGVGIEGSLRCARGRVGGGRR